MTNKNNKGAQDNLLLRPIAYIQNGFDEKFGIPRQSGLAQVRSEIRFVPEFRDSNAVRGIEGFNYLWLIWCFSGNMKTSSAQLSSNSNPDSRELSFLESGTFRPTVRPPRLGGNTHMGVFATRASFRPNGLALSSVKLVGVDLGAEDAPILYVEGADLMDGTPIYDIKPYIPFADSHTDAIGGFTDEYSDGEYRLDVEWSEQALTDLSGIFTDQDHMQSELTSILSEDPRPSYQNDPERIYGMNYAGANIRFRVSGKHLMVLSLQK